MNAANSTVLATTFNFDQSDIRTIDKDNEIWFVAADVLSALTLDRKALERLDEDEAGVSLIHTSSKGITQARRITIINESGLYSLILRSRKPEAKRFKKWITSEVLPAIRKTGKYESASSDGDTLLAAAARHAVVKRFLMCFNSDMKMELHDVGEDAIVISPKSRSDMKTLIQEFIPRDLLPEMLQLGIMRLSAARV